MFHCIGASLNVLAYPKVLFFFTPTSMYDRECPQSLPIGPRGQTRVISNRAASIVAGDLNEIHNPTLFPRMYYVIIARKFAYHPDCVD